MLGLHYLTEKVNMNFNKICIFHVLKLFYVKPLTIITKKILFSLCSIRSSKKPGGKSNKECIETFFRIRWHKDNINKLPKGKMN